MIDFGQQHFGAIAGKALLMHLLDSVDRLGVDHHVLSTDVPEEYAGRAVVCERLGSR